MELKDDIYRSIGKNPAVSSMAPSIGQKQYEQVTVFLLGDPDAVPQLIEE